MKKMTTLQYSQDCMFVKNKESKVSSTIGVYYCKDFERLREFVIKVSYYNYVQSML